MAIEILPARLANQIAAGEVVERPASVIKELVENSLDAGATSIKIDIEKGGAKSIRIADNGKGIVKDELVLALSRHATSKIKNLNDLEAISSLGFRGEALASISSVSRLTLTSKPAEQDSAWQANAEGRDMDVSINPAAHPDGTTIEVNDLFFNTPARRKFLRTEKTEFTHIEEVIRRIALARFDVSFVLSHNGKVVKQYRAARNQSQNAKRVAQICGPKFIENAIEIECQHDDLRLWGWLAKPEYSRSQNDLAYSYVNGRMMRDKLINHAIRQAYANYLPSDSYPAFVLFLELDYREVDVNVHPAKHEVRFHQGRYIHDFIFSVCHEGLTSQAPLEHIESVAGFQQETQHVGQNSPAQHLNAPVISRQSDNEKSNALNYSTDYIAPLEKVSETRSAFDSGHSTSGDRQSYNQTLHRANAPSKQAVSAYNQLMATPVQLPHVENEQLSAQSENQSQSIKSLNTPSANNEAVSLIDTEKNVCIVSIVENKFAVIRINEQLRLLALQRIEQQVNEDLVAAKLAGGIVSQPLLLPVKLTLTKEQLTFVHHFPEQWTLLGIHLQEQANLAIQIRQFPALLRQKDVSQSVFTILDFLENEQKNQRLLIDNNADTTAVNTVFKSALASSFITDEYDINSAKTVLTAFYKNHETQFLSQLMLNSREIDLTSVIKQLL